MKYDIVWDDSFNVGVEIVDKAHQRLMAIVRKMINLAQDTEEEKKRWACEEGIKYFKSYTVKHFAEEESYMRSIDYEEYEKHKQLHDEMREKTIPELERKLEASDYSEEAINEFLGVCMGWLTGHIMIEDRKLTRVDNNRKDIQPDEEELEHLILAISQTIQSLFQLNAEADNERYEGENFGKAIYYKLSYQNLHGEKLHVLFAIEKSLVSSTVGKMLFLTFHKLNKTAISAMQQLAQQITRNLRTYFTHAESSFSLYDDEILSTKEFYQEFGAVSPQYSLLFQTDLGYFAFCIQRP